MTDTALAEGCFLRALVPAALAHGPLCAGIDPSSELLGAWGLADSAEGLRAFAGRCLEAFAGTVAVVKFQVAFFERHGAAGLAALEELLVQARHGGLLVIADAKRGDIASTAAAYAEAWLEDRSPLAADALTAVAYLGLGALQPMIEAAEASGRGLIVVNRSSNPEGTTVQEATGGGGLAVADALVEEMARRNEGFLASHPEAPIGALGAVVGATRARSGDRLASLGGVVLAPGLGTQGATPADAAALFGRCPPGTVVVNASRSVLSAGPSVRRLKEAARALSQELAEAFGWGGAATP